MQNEKVHRRALAVTAVAAVMLIATSIATNSNAFAYESSQAGSLANACGNGEEPFNILCQNLLSQIEGDGNAVNVIGLQTGGERTTSPTEPEPEPPTTGTLTVIKKASCSADISECPGPEDYRFRVFINNGQDPAFSFPGSSTGTTRDIEGGSTYEVEEVHPELLPGQILKTTFSPHCTGTIEAGESLICTFTNEIFLKDSVREPIETG